MSLPRRLLHSLTGEVSIRPAFLITIVVGAALIGGVAAQNLPIGKVSLIAAEGYAQLVADGSGGSFTPDGGQAMQLPAEVPWTDHDGMLHIGGRPECLWGEGETRNIGARVEAGYRWMELPNGGGYPLVAWLRCL
ncbi:hypothetical protein [Microbispora sp. NBRC 16548]|uniref:hypothetical protein n=1 Tax=Microbispora sp. NBRC 16548 TaxID=3030994 RepID=UPI0025557706|nr:hypothetical protein [Microbispora sp. NBRC 16548]